jgi:nitrogen fixation/metabolism regulation signal transduction histidine kinase
VWFSGVSNSGKKYYEILDMITRITLFENEMRPIRYYKNDELNALARAYNRMILQIQDQKESFVLKLRKKHGEKWQNRLHEVKNPLTPMKLTIQNFERKFDPEDPNIRERVNR